MRWFENKDGVEQSAALSPVVHDLSDFKMKEFGVRSPGRTRDKGQRKRSGLTPGPRLFHNLRSSRETELLDIFPVQVVSKWMGHDPKTCLAHYAQTTTDHFEQAVSSAESGAPKAQKQAQQVDAGDGGESQREAINPRSIVSYAIPSDS